MIYELVSRNFDCSLEFVFFSAVTSAFRLFTYKLCLQFSGLRMRNFTWHRFPIKNLLIDSLLTPIVESTCFTGVSDAVRWVVADCYNGLRWKKVENHQSSTFATYFSVQINFSFSKDCCNMQK